MKKWLVGLAGALIATLAYCQAVDINFPLPSINAIRESHPAAENPNLAPAWSGEPATISFLKDSAGTADLRPFCSDGNGTSLAFTVVGGTLGAGLSLANGQISGTPTVTATVAITFRCSDGTLFDDATINIEVSATPTADTSPDDFPFAPQSDVSLNAVGTCPAVTITGINSSTAYSLSTGGGGGSPKASKNGAAFVGGGGTVVNGDTISPQRIASDGYDEVRNITVTIGDKSFTCVITTIANPGRAHILYTLSGEALAAAFNPEWSEWPVALSSTTDGVRVQHIAQDQYGASAAVQALPHFEILTTTNEGFQGLDADGTYFKGTLYHCALNNPVVNYAPLNGAAGNDDKPRVNLQINQALTPMHMLYRQLYRMNIAYGLPSDYVADSVDSREFIMQLTGFDHTGQSAGGGKNNMTLSIRGGRSGGIGAEFYVERFLNGASTKKQAFTITSAMKGKWINFILTFSMDNRTSGGSPHFEWVAQVINPTTKVVESTTVVVADDTTTPWGNDNTTDPDGWTLQLNLDYKGSWCGNSSPGSYDGSKTLPIEGYLDAVRIGDLNSTFPDVTPLRNAHP